MVVWGPLVVAFLVGVVVGWAWRPKWAAAVRTHKMNFFSAWRACDSPSPSSPSKDFWLNSLELQCTSSAPENKVDEEPLAAVPPAEFTDRSREESFVVPEAELKHLYRLVEFKDGGPSWIKMMDRSTPTMAYEAWRRDPEIGPPQYCSRTVFEDALPELVRDFFWDDEFRPCWDDMLISSETVRECYSTGSMVVHWIRKFPFFCSDREYIIGRRIWDSEKSYYCVTKGVPYPSIPRRSKPRRVDLYYSSWCIRSVESRKGNGQLTACEVVLFHHEDMGIPWEIAKLGVRLGMWETVRKIDPGLRSYQQARASGAPLSRPGSMAQTNTKVSPERLRSFGDDNHFSLEAETLPSANNPRPRSKVPKFLIVGGAILLACSLDHGLLTKAVIFGTARRLSMIGNKL